QKERAKIDLYEKEETLRLVMSLGEVFNRSEDEFEVEVQELIDALEKYREKKIVKKKAKPKQTIKTEDLEKAKELLNDKDLIPRLNDLIGESGVVGEENTRLLLYIIASTYKMGYPLHALVQGTSGSGKSHLINSIGKSFPPEDMMSMTRVTSKSFYHYEDDQLVNKLMLIQDFDGLDEEAQYAFRELQSAGTISSSTVYKDRSGNITSKVKQVRSHFASLLATTKAEVYYDNMSRSLIIGVDESEEQTLRIIRHQNRKLAGLVDERKEVEARRTLQNLARALKPYEVINRYADKVQLPMEARMLRRLNSHYQAFVKQITILHQYQREKDDGGRLIATKEDLSMASEILFEAIMIKVDELDSSLRQFFNRMKEFVKSLSTKLGKPPYETVFTQREIRLGLNASKSSCFRYMEDLEQLEYIQKVGGYANRGFKYKIVYFDDMEKVKDKIKTRLKEQLASLGGSEPMEHQTPH
ncbi:ATP-binding protein, partial [Flavobacteriales bacterium]|nr:ATP-binding protein [Flavobacteriales bacterium]